MNLAPGKPVNERMLAIAVLLAGTVALYFGWRAFWFLTDDAFIAFRYVSNSHLGLGYVWNPPPFMPVEGYTSFLWVVLLDLVWRVIGAQPPQSANVIAFAFSAGTLWIGAIMLLRMDLRERLAAWRIGFLVLFVAFLVLNRTFLAWSSSGLETSLFVLLVTVWVYAGLFVETSPRKAGMLSTAAALLALTRPDGLLFAACTAFIVVLLSRDTRPRRTLIWGLVPLVVIPAHLLWRRGFYGEWLPNTYFAKVVGAWPESGARYLLSFALEYALWFSGVFVVWALIRLLRAGGWRLSSPPRIIRGLVVAALVLHFAYYTFVVGGDHFEYRIYTHLLPLLFLVFVWALSVLRLRAAMALTIATLFVLLSLPLPWTHWNLTKDIDERRNAHVLRMGVAQHWPGPVRWYAQEFDELQRWLITHHVGMRHQEHKVLWQTQEKYYGTREVGSRVRWPGRHVHATGTVGVPAWVMPHVAILDESGLNDWVVARTPPSREREGLMAHSRQPPPGYVDEFRPDVFVSGRGIVLRERQRRLTDLEIADIELRWKAWIGDGAPSLSRE